MAVEEIWQHSGNIRKKFSADAAGLFVRTSRPDGPARKAGLKEWELIQSVDGKRVERSEDLLTYIRSKKPGEAVKLSVLAPDSKKPRSVTIPLADLEALWAPKPKVNPVPMSTTGDKDPDSSSATATRGRTSGHRRDAISR